MSKVFSAKRASVDASYEFLDGKDTPLNVVAMSSNEGKELNDMLKKEGVTEVEFAEKLARIMLQKNDKKVVDKIIKEQFEEGNISDFTRELSLLLEETKKGKVARLIRFAKEYASGQSYLHLKGYLDAIDDDACFKPQDAEEHLLISCFDLALVGSMNGAECQYIVVKDFCKSHKLDTFSVYGLCKSMTAELNSKK